MSQAEEFDPPSRHDSNNATSRSSQNKSKILEATVRNVPKLKELNYTQWKNVITNSIKNAKLWGYVDGSIGQPSEEDASDLATYFDEAGAVRSAILGSLESGAQKYIEEALDPRDAWVTLEKKYLTAEADIDSKVVTVEKQLADLRLEEGGDVIEHIADFCRMRSQLNGTRFALDDQASISMLYRSLPVSYRQSAVTSDGTEMKDFGALCARLSYLSQNPELPAPTDNNIIEDYTSWGVPGDVKAFGLTGGKNPLLTERAAVTCRDCLLKGHKAGASECPQYEWRKELWGATVNPSTEEAYRTTTDSEAVKTTRKLNYKFSEPVKVVLSFSEMGLKKDLSERLGNIGRSIPFAIQQCSIIPMIEGRNILAQAPKGGGKTTAVALSALQAIDMNVPKPQVLVLTRDAQEANRFREMILDLTQTSSGFSWLKCYLCDDNPSVENDLSQVVVEHVEPIILGTPALVLKLFRRSILPTKHLKMLLVDDVEQIIASGFGKLILDIRRCLPCSAQTALTYTSSSLELIEATKELMINPLYLTVEDNTVTTIQGWHSNVHSLVGGISSSQCYYQITSFLRVHDSGYDTTLIINDTTPSAWANVVDQPNIPFVHYHAPRNRKEYAKRLTVYRGPGKNTTVVTFVTANTDEIHVIREVEGHYNIQMVELYWDGKSVSWGS